MGGSQTSIKLPIILNLSINYPIDHLCQNPQISIILVGKHSKGMYRMYH